MQENKRIKQNENNGITIILAITEIIETLLNMFAHTGKITIFVLIEIASPDAKTCGHLIFNKSLVTNGDIDIIANTHKNDNWKPTSNNDNGLNNRIITPAKLKEFSPSYL